MLPGRHPQLDGRSGQRPGPPPYPLGRPRHPLRRTTPLHHGCEPTGSAPTTKYRESRSSSVCLTSARNSSRRRSSRIRASLSLFLAASAVSAKSSSRRRSCVSRCSRCASDTNAQVLSPMSSSALRVLHVVERHRVSEPPPPPPRPQQRARGARRWPTAWRSRARVRERAAAAIAHL